MLLFIYGTLKRGRHNHRYLSGQKYICNVHTGPLYSLVVSGLPFLLKRPGMGCMGELWDVSEHCLAKLDRLEGHPDFYERVPIVVRNPKTNEKYSAETYIHPDVFSKEIRAVMNYTG
jgi:gamma-glutamylaminecyclotransferase